MIEDTITLSIPILPGNYTYDKIAQRLFIDGPAIEEGVWSGTGSPPIFFPRDVLIEACPLFNGVPLVCEHRGLEIGLVNKVEVTRLGFRIVDAVVTHQESIDAILSGDKTGFSIEGVFTYDEIRLIARKITQAKNISLVSNPACKVCGIEHIYIDRGTPEGIVAMSEEIIEEGTRPDDESGIDTDSVIMSSIDVVEENASKPIEVIEEVEPTVEVEDEISNLETVAIEDVTSVTEATPPEDVIMSADTEAIEEPATPGVPPVEYIADLAEIKVALSTATSTMEAVSLQLQSASVKLKEMEVALSSAKAELSSTKEELSAVRQEAEVYRKTIEKLQEQIKTAEEAERNKIMSEIKVLDPDVDINLITSMSTVQLSAYKSTVDRFVSKSMIAGERKSVKADEIVELSAPKDHATFDRHDVASGIVPFLKQRQKNTYSSFGT